MKIVNKTPYWLTPVKSSEKRTAEVCITTLVDNDKIWAFGKGTYGMNDIKKEIGSAFILRKRCSCSCRSGLGTEEETTSPCQ